jgi:Flp pilus assembly protein TadD
MQGREAMTRQFVRPLLVSAVAVLMLSVAIPVQAQQGSLRGKVVDESGKPVPEAELTLDFVGDFSRQLKTVTDKNGEWVRAGMPSGGGTWNITVKKGNLVGSVTGIRVSLGEMTRVPEIVVRPPGAAGAASKAPAAMSQEEAERRNKRQKELEGLFNESNKAFDSGNYDAAIATLTKIATELPTCGACYARIGDAYLKKNDAAEAEKAFLKAIEIDPKLAGAYSALASLYNTQKKLDEASKMSQKAMELLEAGGGGDAGQIYNQGVILWNQSKAAEAGAMFEKAIKLDPKMADAHYWYGMSLVNQGKMAEAKAPFQEYLKLAPTGQHAATAKAILDTIK